MEASILSVERDKRTNGRTNEQAQTPQARGRDQTAALHEKTKPAAQQGVQGTPVRKEAGEKAQGAAGSRFMGPVGVGGKLGLRDSHCVGVNECCSPHDTSHLFRATSLNVRGKYPVSFRR